jgi:hypothetical protein
MTHFGVDRQIFLYTRRDRQAGDEAAGESDLCL